MSRAMLLTPIALWHHRSSLSLKHANLIHIAASWTCVQRFHSAGEKAAGDFRRWTGSSLLAGSRPAWTAHSKYSPPVEARPVRARRHRGVSYDHMAVAHIADHRCAARSTWNTRQPPEPRGGRRLLLDN